MATGSTKLKTMLVAMLVTVWASSAATHVVPGKSTAESRATVGAASWYGQDFHGRRTASGERFDMHELTAAHRTLPFGTRLRVTNENNGRSVVVRVNDRGPFAGKRVIDLSRGAAEKIGLLKKGVGRVRIEMLPRT